MSSNTNTAVSSANTSNKPASVTATGRPSLKNLTRARVPRAGLIGLGISIVSAVAWQILVSNKHKHEIAAFYKAYDPERDYARMKAAGVFKSLEGRERPEWLSEYESELDDAIASLRSTVGGQSSNKLGAADDE